MFRKRGCKSGQVWVETVVYTLIALTIIGLFISFAKPKIEEIQDKAIIDQSIEMLEDINSIILSIVQGGVGNQRIIEVGIKKGTLEIDGISNRLVFEIDGRYTYTEPGPDGEPGEFINIRNILASTQKRGKISTVTLISNYTNIYNITYRGEDDKKLLGKAPVAHKLSISNKGDIGGKPIINFELK
jgi:hypothetical protein